MQSADGDGTLALGEQIFRFLVTRCQNQSQTAFRFQEPLDTTYLSRKQCLCWCHTIGGTKRLDFGRPQAKTVRKHCLQSSHMVGRRHFWIPER